jgi:hypothetical protein
VKQFNAFGNRHLHGFGFDMRSSNNGHCLYNSDSCYQKIEYI